LEIHKYYSVVAGVNRDGEEVLSACRVAHSELESWLAKQLLPTDRVVIESTTNACHVYDLLEPLVKEQRQGVTRPQFARYYLMRLGIGSELKRVSLDPEFPYKLAPLDEVLDLYPELRPPG
jgi:hypothetical protein